MDTRGSTGYFGGYWKILEDIGGYLKILGGIGGYWEVLGDIVGYWMLLEDIGRYWKVLEGILEGNTATDCSPKLNLVGRYRCQGDSTEE